MAPGRVGGACSIRCCVSESSRFFNRWGRQSAGNVGIIRSQVCAIALPDQRLEEAGRAGGGARQLVEGSEFSRRWRGRRLEWRVDFQIRSACAPNRSPSGDRRAETHRLQMR
jgi:hypothetical protein